jgi:hypothetical protein
MPGYREGSCHRPAAPDGVPHSAGCAEGPACHRRVALLGGAGASDRGSEHSCGTTTASKTGAAVCSLTATLPTGKATLTVNISGDSITHHRGYRAARVTARVSVKREREGDAVLWRQAWEIADQLGWASTLCAEYVALTQLQADALITLNDAIGVQRPRHRPDGFHRRALSHDDELIALPSGVPSTGGVSHGFRANYLYAPLWRTS